MALVAEFLSVSRYSHLMNLNAMLANCRLRTGNFRFVCHEKPLLNFIESYESPDDKKCCHFVTSACRFVSPDSSVVIRTQQDDSIARDDSNTRLTDVSSQHSLTPDGHVIDQNPGNCDSSPVLKPCTDFMWNEKSGKQVVKFYFSI